MGIHATPTALTVIHHSQQLIMEASIYYWRGGRIGEGRRSLWPGVRGFHQGGNEDWRDKRRAAEKTERIKMEERSTPSPLPQNKVMKWLSRSTFKLSRWEAAICGQTETSLASLCCDEARRFSAAGTVLTPVYKHGSRFCFVHFTPCRETTTCLTSAPADLPDKHNISSIVSAWTLTQPNQARTFDTQPDWT